MINKDNDGRDDTANTASARPGVTTVKPAVRDAQVNVPANSTPGYSAGNPEAKETPANKVSSYSTRPISEVAPANVISPAVSAEKVAAKVASEKAFDDRAHELDLARRALDGSGDGVRIGRDGPTGYVNHDATTLTTLDEIDRQSAILNKERRNAKDGLDTVRPEGEAAKVAADKTAAANKARQDGIDADNRRVPAVTEANHSDAAAKTAVEKDQFTKLRQDKS